MNRLNTFHRSRRWIWVGIILCVGICVGRAGQGEEKKDAKKTVAMTIAYGDGVEKRFTALAWKEGMTVADTLTLAQEHPRGIKFKSRGKNETILVQEIDGLANGTGDKYWIFAVNDKERDSSCGVAKLQAGDAILWRFGTYP